jgi:hypothetical protein
MGEMTADRYSGLKPVTKEDKVFRKFCRVLDSDLLTLDLTQEEQDRGHRYLKIYVPTGRFEEGWLTYSEIEDGWNVSCQKTIRRDVSASKRRKLNRRKNQKKMLDEVKKYISVE